MIIGCLFIFPYLILPRVLPLNAASPNITHQSVRPISPQGTYDLKLTAREVVRLWVVYCFVNDSLHVTYLLELKKVPELQQINNKIQPCKITMSEPYA